MSITRINELISRDNLQDRIPAVAGFLLRPVPRRVSRQAIAVLFNRLFSSSLLAGEMNFLCGRRAAIVIPDIPLRFSVTLSGRKLRVQEVDSREDVTIAIASRDVALLAAGQVDPDTLFFRRRLMMSGDTELGLALKNFLDAVDIQTPLEKVLPTPLNHLKARFFQRA